MVAKKKTASAADDREPNAINIDRIRTETLLVPIVGATPLLVNRFNEKAKREMLDIMQGRKSPRQPKDPQADYEGSLYTLKDGGYGFPVIGFKAATVSAARFYHGITMVQLKQFLFFRGEIDGYGDMMARIDGVPRMREDVTVVGRGQRDLRYRAEFPEWSTTLEVVYSTPVIMRSSVLSLIDAGGMAIGVGEWRPEKDGTHGTYRIDDSREVVVLS